MSIRSQLKNRSQSDRYERTAVIYFRVVFLFTSTSKELFAGIDIQERRLAKVDCQATSNRSKIEKVVTRRKKLSKAP